MRILFKRASGREKEMRYQYSGDAGFDIPVCFMGEIPPRSFATIRTGVSIVVFQSEVGDGPDPYALDVRPRSGLCRGGVQVFALFYFPSGREVEIVLPVYNALDSPFHFDAGYRLAQGVLCRLGAASVFEARKE